MHRIVVSLSSFIGAIATTSSSEKAYQISRNNHDIPDILRHHRRRSANEHRSAPLGVVNAKGSTSASVPSSIWGV